MIYDNENDNKPATVKWWVWPWHVNFSCLSVTWLRRVQWIWQGAGYFASVPKFTPSTPTREFVSRGLLNIIQQNGTHGKSCLPEVCSYSPITFCQSLSATHMIGRSTDRILPIRYQLKNKRGIKWKKVKEKYLLLSILQWSSGRKVWVWS